MSTAHGRHVHVREDERAFFVLTCTGIIGLVLVVVVVIVRLGVTCPCMESGVCIVRYDVICARVSCECCEGESQRGVRVESRESRPVLTL